MKIRSFTISLLVLIVFSMYLTSCSDLPVSPTLTPPVTQTATITAEPTKTETPEPTETPAPAESDLRPAYTETIAGELLGVQITTNLITDESLDPTITAIKINDHYKNSEGKNSKEALTEFTATTFYKVWLKNGGVDGTGPKNDVSFEEYMAMWAKAQSPSGTEADWRAVQITIKANDIATEGYEPVPTVIWPMYSGTAPEGVRAINEFDIAFVKSKKVKNIEIIDEASNFGFGTNILDKKLSIYITPPTSKDLINIKNLLRRLVTIPNWMITNRRPSNFEDPDMSNIISTKHSNALAYSAALQIFPSSSVDQQYNP